MLIVQAFFSLSITIIAYAMPADAQHYVLDYSSVSDKVDLNSTATKVESALQQQTKIPVVEIGALVFFSGNIIVDLFLNFVFAIPEMVGLFLHTLFSLINLDTFMWSVVEIFSGVIIVVFYFIGLIQMIASIRSGSKFI
jgi:hypothetical protein